MSKSSDNIRKLNLSKKELRVIAREKGVKNYEHLSKSVLIKEINKLKPSKGPKKIVSSLLLKEKKVLNLNQEKTTKKKVLDLSLKKK